MAWMKAQMKRIVAGMHEAIRDDTMRKELMFGWLNILLGIVSLFMTLVNLATHEYTLMMGTFFFMVACIGNILLIKRGGKPKTASYSIFFAESMLLLGFFVVSGIPNGFSALWVCLIPSFSLLIFGRKYGTCFSLMAFLMLLFFFWLPYGKGLLQYRYTDEFMLRFPFFYVACFLLALLVEVIRAQTQKQLLESEQQYRYLYRHDALTGLYNRYGFNLVVDEDYAKGAPGKVGLMIIDIDDFKQINDQYGHNNGDVVLRGIADIIRSSFCKQNYYCRWGGEEFTVYLHCEHDYEKAAERFRRRVEEAEFQSGKLAMKVTVSVGLCTAQSIKKTNVAMLVNHADRCLYQAKDAGKNRVISTEI